MMCSVWLAGEKHLLASFKAVAALPTAAVQLGREFHARIAGLLHRLGRYRCRLRTVLKICRP
jgi:hypothetical protein